MGLGSVIQDPRSGSRGQKGTGSRIRIRNTAKHAAIFDNVQYNYWPELLKRTKCLKLTVIPTRPNNYQAQFAENLNV